MILAIIFLCIVMNNGRSNRLTSYAYAIISWTFIMYAGIEVLSLFHLLQLSTIIIYWGIIDCTLLIYLIKKKRFFSLSFKQLFGNLAKGINLLSLLMIFIIVISLVLALKTVPSNWDSMTYHLPRIMHWIQNRTVAHYATNSVRQVGSPILAEFVSLYIIILSGKRDFLINLLQWSSYVTCAILVYGVCRKLGCSKILSNFGSIMFLSLPIAFAESMTTQNDLFSALWLLLFVYLILDIYQCNHLSLKEHWWCCIMLSMCIAFGYLTKPSVMFGILSFSIGLLIFLIKRKDTFKEIIRLLFLGSSAITAIVLPEILRNLATFNSISAPIVSDGELQSGVTAN